MFRSTSCICCPTHYLYLDSFTGGNRSRKYFGHSYRWIMTRIQSMGVLMLHTIHSSCENQWGCFWWRHHLISVFDSIQAIGTRIRNFGPEIRFNWCFRAEIFLWSHSWIVNPNIQIPWSPLLLHYTPDYSAGSCVDTLQIYVGVKPFPNFCRLINQFALGQTTNFCQRWNELWVVAQLLYPILLRNLLPILLKHTITFRNWRSSCRWSS